MHIWRWAHNYRAILFLRCVFVFQISENELSANTDLSIVGPERYLILLDPTLFA